MMTSDPRIERYLSDFNSHLDEMPLGDRREAVDEIHRHIADAVAAGQQLEVVLESLGPTRLLAKGYDPPSVAHCSTAPRPQPAWAMLVVAGFFTLGAVPTFVATITLGIFGTGFLVTGLALFASGMATMSGVLPPSAEMNGSPVGAVIVGPAFATVGMLAIVTLVGYFWLAKATAQRLLPVRSQINGSE